jgi:pyocin large subunit-like protein
MTIEAVSTVFSMWIDRSSAKFVLVAMANLADQNMVCWPSMEYLCQATCQDRKTVLANIKRLKAMGLISDTEQRKGRTSQVAVYRLNIPENGTVKASQKRNSTENGTVPKTDAKGTVFPPKGSQKRDTEPSRNQKEPSIEKKSVDQSTQLPDWIPAEAFNGFMEMRKSIKAPMTNRAIGLAISKLKTFKDQGFDIEAILDQSTSNNWKDLYPVKGHAIAVATDVPWAGAR